MLKRSRYNDPPHSNPSTDENDKHHSTDREHVGTSDHVNDPGMRSARRESLEDEADCVSDVHPGCKVINNEAVYNHVYTVSVGRRRHSRLSSKEVEGDPAGERSHTHPNHSVKHSKKVSETH